LIQSAASSRRSKRRGRIDRTALIILAPALAILLIFRIVPLVAGAWLSLTKWSGIGDPKFIGLDNYARLLSDPAVVGVVQNNLLFLGALELVGIPFALGVAVLLQSQIFGWKFFRIAFFVPYVMSPLVIGIYWSAALRSDGPVNSVLDIFGLGSLGQAWLIGPMTALPLIALILIWMTFGVSVILFMAGLAAINPDLYDAAKVDGAGWFQSLRFVTVPELTYVIGFQAINLLIFSFAGLFPFIYSLTGGGPGHSTSVVELKLYQAAFQSRQVGYGSAIGMAILVVLVVVIAVAYWLISRRRREVA